MRLAAFIATLICLAAAAYAGQQAWQVWQNPLPPSLDVATQDIPDPAQPSAAPAPPPRAWPALFGEPQPPKPSEPQPPASPEAEPQPPAPPLSSLGYALKGVVSDGGTRWALVSHPTGDALLQVGDPLGDSYTVAAIDARGLWVVAAPGADPQLLEFAE